MSWRSEGDECLIQWAGGSDCWMSGDVLNLLPWTCCCPDWFALYLLSWTVCAWACCLVLEVTFFCLDQPSTIYPLCFTDSLPEATPSWDSQLQSKQRLIFQPQIPQIYLLVILSDMIGWTQMWLQGGYYKSHRSQGKLREERGERYSEDGGSEERGELFSYPLILWMSSLYTVLRAWELTVSTI